MTTGVGGTGVVGVLKNGAGPTVMLRTELDALPVEEKTGLPYASTVRVKDDAGAEVSVMHACGHDVHMTALVGTAAEMARRKADWHGTLIFIGQPAEERIRGARAMLKDGLFTRFPKPDFVVALHDTPNLPAGQLGVTSGYTLASSDSVDLTIYGKGGHGASPQTTVDPIVIAARTVLALQTIVAREKDPQDPAVVTVGSIHGGNKHNIIPDEVKLQITVRAYKEEVRKHILAAIERIAKAEAAAANAPKEPAFAVVESCPRDLQRPQADRADRGDAPPDLRRRQRRRRCRRRWPPRTSASMAWRESRRSSGAWAPAIPRSSRSSKPPASSPPPSTPASSPPTAIRRSRPGWSRRWPC